MSEFESLPLELLYLILSFLPLESVYKLGSTNKHLYSLITKNQSFWRFKVLKSHGIKIIRDQEPEEESRDIRLPAHPSGMIADSSLEGDREVFLIFSEEFGAFLRHLRSKSEQQSDAAVIGSFFKSLLPRSWGLHRGIHYLSRMDPNFSARLALFGPGIESPKTKLLVHKMVNSHSSVFNALDFVAGLPGGFGSGVRIDFKSIYKFDLMCLYTNSIHVRESHRGVCRYDDA